MKAKEKAQELVDKMFYSIVDKKTSYTLRNYWAEAKQCAIIAVDEILRVLFQHHEIDFYKEVKSEIEKL